jgi:hypothetical protein
MVQLGTSEQRKLTLPIGELQRRRMVAGIKKRPGDSL